MFTLFLTMFLLLCAVVIDVGYWWVNGKKAQIAADACALAAAQSIPGVDPTSGIPNKLLGECVITGTGPDYVLANLHKKGTAPEPRWNGTEVEWPYVDSAGVSDATKVEARVYVSVGTFFGKIVGLNGVGLTRRAVAQRAEGEGNYAIYSHSPGCPGDGTGESLRFNGDTHWINGRVHSNGEYFVDNGPVPGEPFWAKVGTKVHCTSFQPHGQPRFGGDGWATGGTTPDTVPPQVWPAWWTPANFGWVDNLDVSDTGCDVKGKSILIKEDGGNTRIEVDSPIGPQPNLVFPGNTITTGYTYCAWEKFTINRINLVATLTALSPLITVDGDNQELSPHAGTAQGQVLFFAVPNITSAQDGSQAAGGNPICTFPPPQPEMILNGNSHEWTGVVFNPCGRVIVNVGGSNIGNPAITGTILGWQVHVNGEDFFMEGKDTFGGNVELGLVE